MEEVRKFRERIGEGLCVMGLDVGEKKVGVAVSDAALKVAAPLEVLGRRGVMEGLRKVVEVYGVGGVVMGLPLTMGGYEGKRVHQVRGFGGEVGKRLGLPLLYWDERLSTAAVRRVGGEEKEDERAAAWILQGVLEMMRVQEEVKG